MNSGILQSSDQGVCYEVNIRTDRRRNNHPPKGSTIMVEPIRNIKSIVNIRAMLRRHSLRDDLLFTMGINNSLRISDLLNIRVDDVRDKVAGTIIPIKEQFGGKSNILIINNVIYETLQKYLQYNHTGEWLFQSRKGNSPLSIASVNAMIKQWTSTFQVAGNYGAQSLRKTWGYHQYTRFGVSIKVLCKRFNHASPTTTMKYLCLTDYKTDYTLAENELGVITPRII